MRGANSRELQPSKANPSTSVKELGMVTLAKKLQPPKANLVENVPLIAAAH